MSPGRTRKSPTGQIPKAWSPLSGPIRLPSSRLGSEADTVRKPVDRGDDRRDGEHERRLPRSAEPDRKRRTGCRSHEAPPRPPPQGRARRPRAGSARRRSPHTRPRAAGRASSGRPRPERPGHERRRAARSSQASGELLDPAPQRVAEEERRLAATKAASARSGRSGTSGPSERVQREREHRGEERDIGLEEPGEVLAEELVPDAERQGARRVAARA